MSGRTMRVGLGGAAILSFVLAAPIACNGLLGNGDVTLGLPDAAADAGTTVTNGQPEAGPTPGEDASDASTANAPDAPAPVGEDAGTDDAPAAVDAADAGEDAEEDAGVCADGGAANACHECAELDASPGDPCGATCGSLQCVADGGGLACNDLSSGVGAPCGANGCGTTTCSASGTSVVCSGDHAKNVCGGCGTVAAQNGASASGKPNDPCGACDNGTTVCADQNTLTCVGATTNACGGCGTLAAAPNTSCGTCSGTWTCSSDKSSVTCTGDHAENSCGGCATLSPAFGASCASSGKGACATSGTYARAMARTCDPVQRAGATRAGVVGDVRGDEREPRFELRRDGRVQPALLAVHGVHVRVSERWDAMGEQRGRDLRERGVRQFLQRTCHRRDGLAVDLLSRIRRELPGVWPPVHSVPLHAVRRHRCVYAEHYCETNNGSWDPTTANCTIRNDVLEECE